ncbi:MAG: hypothetical protein J6B48_09675 [Clostridia bacterium]|nr:hypothetical protein [Clostridia bacterium]
MKKQTKRNFKILALTLSVMLMVSCIFIIGTSAEDSPSTGEFIAQSVVYGDKYQIAFIVDCTDADAEAGTVSLKYKWAGEETEKSAELFTGDKGTTDRAIFVTEGVAAYHLTREATATTYLNGTPVETKSYSIATFLYNKLFRDGFINAAESDANYADKLVYTSLITYGAASQTAHLETPGTLITDYKYVGITDGVLATDATNSGASTKTGGIYTYGSTVYPYAEGVAMWEITYTAIDAYGVKSTAKEVVPNGEAVAIKDNASFAPTTVSAGKYYDSFGGYDFASNTVTQLAESGKMGIYSAGGLLRLDDLGKADAGYVAIGTQIDGTLKAIVGSSTSWQPAAYGLIGSASDANCVVFETDIRIDIVKTPTSYSSSNHLFRFGLTTGYTDSSGTQGAADYCAIVPLAENDYRFINGNASVSISENEWFNLCIEYYKDSGTFVYYINGTEVSRINSTAGTAYKDAWLVMGAPNQGNNFEIKDSYVGAIDKTLAE